MPYTIKKVRVKGKVCYSVRSPSRVHSYCTTLEKALRQKRLLDHLLVASRGKEHVRSLNFRVRVRASSQRSRLYGGSLRTRAGRTFQITPLPHSASLADDGLSIHLPITFSGGGEQVSLHTIRRATERWAASMGLELK